MSKFEFIMMFVSVVVAFSMAELMMGWGRLIRMRQRLTRPLFMIGWSACSSPIGAAFITS